MALAKTDWKQYRAANSEIPPDIFFQVLPSKSTRDRNIEMEEEEEVDKTKMIGVRVRVRVYCPKKNVQGY